MSEWKYFFLFGSDARGPDYTPGKAKRRNFKAEKKRPLLPWFVLDLLGSEAFFSLWFCWRVQSFIWYIKGNKINLGNKINFLKALLPGKIISNISQKYTWRNFPGKSWLSTVEMQKNEDWEMRRDWNIRSMMGSRVNDP